MQHAIVSRLSSILLCGWAAAQLLACGEAAGVPLEDEATAGVTVGPGVGFASQPLVARSTLSVLGFHVTATEPMFDGVFGLSQGAPSGFDDLAAAVRFAPSGVIEVRDGTVYRADVFMQYQPGATYRIYVIANILSHTYSVYVHEPGLASALATGYAFQPSQLHVTGLDTLSAIVDSPSGQLSINYSDNTDTSAVAYAREGVYAMAPLPGGKALLSDRGGTTWKLGQSGQVLKQVAHGGEVAADDAGNVYVAQVAGDQLVLRAFTRQLKPRWSLVDTIEPFAGVRAIAADAAGVSIVLGAESQVSSIRRYPACGDTGAVVHTGGTQAALAPDGFAVATSDENGIAVSFHDLDGHQRWSRSFDVPANVQFMTLGLSGRVVLVGHYWAPLTFGGPTLEGWYGDPPLNNYAVALARADGAHVFTTDIPATFLRGADANAGRLVIAGEVFWQQFNPYVWKLDPDGNVLGAYSSIFFEGWGRSGRVAIDPSNRIYWELSVDLFGLDIHLSVFPYLVVLQP